MKITAENTPLMKYTRTTSSEDLDRAVNAMCTHKSKQGNIGLNFSMWSTNPDSKWHVDNNEEWLLDHPDIWSKEPVFEGDCIFLSDYWRIAENKVFSEVIKNPTWKDIIIEANRQLIDPEDGSTACLFLEGIYLKETREDGIKVYEFSWGS